MSQAIDSIISMNTSPERLGLKVSVTLNCDILADALNFLDRPFTPLK